MAQKSKAASLTPDLLTSKSVPTTPAPRKQSTDLSLAPLPKASQPEAVKPVAPPPAKAKAKAKDIEPARKADASKPDAPRQPESVPDAKAETGAVSEAPPSGATAAKKTVPVAPIDGPDKGMVANEEPTSEAHQDYRIRIPVPLDPSEHLELTLAAARSGRSCQEIIVEALFRYLEDIAGPPDRSAAPGPDGQR